MKPLLTVAEIKTLISKAEEGFRHPECATCECYLAYITQLEMDSDQKGQQLIADLFPDSDQIHSCLGCDPCPPGILYNDYLRKHS